MRPEVYLRVLRRGWWVIVVAALVAAAIGYISQAGQPKTYEASTRLVVTSMPIDYFSDQLTANWAQALEPYVHNPNAVQSAMTKGYLRPEDASLAYNAATRSNRDNRTVTIAATDRDPARAARVVGALAHIVVDKSRDDNAALDEQDARLSRSSQQNIIRTPRLVITSLDCAVPSAGLFSSDVAPNCPSPPSVANGPRVRLTAIAGLVLGGVLGLLVVMAAAALDDSLKGRDDVRHYLHMPVIASIPRPRSRQREIQ